MKVNSNVTMIFSFWWVNRTFLLNNYWVLCNKMLWHVKNCYIINNIYKQKNISHMSVLSPQSISEYSCIYMGSQNVWNKNNRLTTSVLNACLYWKIIWPWKRSTSKVKVDTLPVICKSSMAKVNQRVHNR